jgi:Mg-chelatase subunit ChlI
LFDNVPERQPQAVISVSPDDVLEVYGQRLAEAMRREVMASAANRAAVKRIAALEEELSEARARITELETTAANAINRAAADVVPVAGRATGKNAVAAE